MLVFARCRNAAEHGPTNGHLKYLPLKVSACLDVADCV
jgi:hypothetical protein